ncbi:MAG: polysaccharide biosynthesis tyrosine autokinase [Candidatus Rokubacteria bacterium]|nr:polysaccharide biosynthesis tyrosine autokinase [Candidatus Rokubacteria bacterium]
MDILTVLKQVAQSVMARRKKWVLAGIALALLVSIPIAYWLSQEPPRYRTSALILIENKPDRSPLFQEFSPYRPLAVQFAILRSRSLAEVVIESLPRATVEDLIENPYSRDYALEFQNWIRRLRGEEIVVESPQRRALAELQQARVRFTPQGESGIVAITAEASKPRASLDIANTYIEALLSRTRSFNVDDTKVTREFLEQQHAQVSQALGQSDGALRQFTLARSGIKPPARNAETVQRLAQVEQTLAEIQANKNMSQNRLAAMKAKLDALPVPAPSAPRVAAPRPPPPSQRIQILRGKLASLERQLLEYESLYTDRHPRVAGTRRQIDEVRAELGDAVKDMPQVAAASSASAVPAQDRAAFAETVAALESSVMALGAQEEALRDQGATLRRSLSGLSRDEMEYTRLSSDNESNRRLQAVLSEKMTAARMREQGEMKVVKVIDPPQAPFAAANQKRLKFLGVALALALVIGAGVPVAVEYFNRPVQTEQDVRQLTGLPVLSTIPLVRSRRSMFLLGSGQPEDVRQEDYFLFLEAFRKLRVEIQLLGREMPMRRVMIASALPGEGKSTVVVNLGLTFGEVGKQVIIADADFHRPTLHRTLKTPNDKGFSDLLAGTGELRESMSLVAEGVWLSPRGGSSTALSRTGLGSQRLTEVIESMAAEAEYVLLDSSPILLIPDNLYMAAAADGVLLVVQSGVTRPRELLRTKDIIEKSGTPIIGVVLNQVPVKAVNQYYNYYRSYVRQDSKA